MTVSDDDLLARLRAAAAEGEAPPALAYETARAAFGLRSLDAELAELVADSLESAGAMRGTATVRMLSFEAGTVTVEVEVEVDPHGQDTRRVLGQVEGASGRVAVDTPVGTITVPLDELGRFVVESVGAGPLRLRVLRSDGGIIATSWTTV